MNAFFFQPIFQQRVWGGRQLESLFGRALPPAIAIGESWELVDRPEACSRAISGPGVGKAEPVDLHTLWSEKRIELFGTRSPDVARFPILIKLLDARENLSVQVHPPAGQGGEPKTELWYFLETTPEACVYAGFKKGVTRAKFEAQLGQPGLAELLHRIRVEPSDALFLPSGRVHAIGAGNVILEIQQNSDTTYRVDDWGRLDAEGKPRDLHRAEALQAIRFDDPTPTLVQPHAERVLQCPFFTVERSFIYPGEYRLTTSDSGSFQYHFIAQGDLKIDDRLFKRGDSWLVPANAETHSLEPINEGAELITVMWGR